MYEVFLLTDNSHCEANRKIFRRKIALTTTKKEDGVPSVGYNRRLPRRVFDETQV